MRHITRLIKPRFTQYLEHGRSILLLGPRQTGKTTLIKEIPAALKISFIQPRVRLKYEKDPSLLADEIEVIREQESTIPTVIIDEIQKVPSIMDVVQDLIDRNIAKFILTGSSARKLRRGQDINLLPGRVMIMHLDPFSYTEIKDQKISLDDLLIQGSLPGIILTPFQEERDDLLEAYVTTYLEEEIRSEAVVRNLGAFSKFLELAASESGKAVNYTKLSQEIGIAHSTITSYYQILQDCLIVEAIEAFTKSSTRKKLSKAKKYLFFDMGVRRVAAREGIKLPNEYKGRLFEQFVGLELIRHSRITQNRARLLYWRDPDGPEVDWVLESPTQLTPIEVKWSETPTLADAKHLIQFLTEYPEATKGYIICRAERRMKITDNIYAIPWQEINTL